MILNRLQIKNFKCYENTTFEFAERITVLIGKNGSGKSSLLAAIKDALSFIFSKSDNSWGYTSLANGIPGLGVANIPMQYVYRVRGQRPGNEVELRASATWNSVNLNWQISKASSDKAKVKSTLYKDAYIKFMDKHGTSGLLPLFAYYSDRYPHVSTSTTTAVRRTMETDNLPASNWGYFQWDYISSCTYMWRMRYINVFNRQMNDERSKNDYLNQGKEIPETLANRLIAQRLEIEYVTKLLKTFTSNTLNELSDLSEDWKIRDLRVNGSDNFYMELVFEDGSTKRWEELPAGYERLLSIVLDLAYRSFFLNKGQKEPFGIVIIDEVDLHLHPSLEQDVLVRFRETFPKIQFILATHSPLVISNFLQDDKHKVIKMRYENDEYSHEDLDNTYGLDYNITLDEYMDTKPYNIIVDGLKEKYVRLKRRGKDDIAEAVKKQLSDMMSLSRFEETMKQLDERVKRI